MRPTRSLLLPLALAVAGGLPVAGGAAAAETPVGAVEALLDGIVARDPVAIEAAACEGFGIAVAGALDPVPALRADATAEADAAALAAALAVRVDDRAVSVIEETGDAATVAVAGRLTVEVDPAAARAWVIAQLEAAGQPTGDPAVDAALEAFVAALGSGRDLAMTADVVRSDGAWRVCGGMGIAVPGEPAPVRADLCALASVAEVAAATGLPLTEAWASEDACTWAGGAGTTEPVTVTALLLDGALAPLQAVWKPGRDIEVDGRATWATRNGTWVALDEGLLAVLPTLEWSDAAQVADAIEAGVAVAELLVPRLP